MKARLRNGFIVNGRLAKIFADRGIATIINDVADTNEPVKVNEKQPVKRTRRTKAEIEAAKNKEV